MRGPKLKCFINNAFEFLQVFCHSGFMELIATTAFGLEKPVYDELKKLGLWIVKTEDGRVIFNGDELAMMRANLWSRCADRILIKLGEFDVQTFDELFDHISAIEWEKYIWAQDAFPVQASSVKSTLHSEPAVQSIIKKAIVKRLQLKHGVEQLPENSGAVFQVMVKANKNRFVVGLNTSGESLHKRGYRIETVLAPIKETLAAALVKLSDWTLQRSLVDLFCGSGTIGIEAALIASNIAPGIKRGFAFEKWPWIDPKNMQAVRLEAQKMMKHFEAGVLESGAEVLVAPQRLPIYGFDIDAEALKIAEENTIRAGIGRINFKRADFMDLDFSKFENCTFICNPPYGERLEDAARVKEMYRKLGQKFAQTKNCSLYLITSDETFPALFAEGAKRQPDKNRKLFNGNIRCYLFQYSAKPVEQVQDAAKK